MVSKTCPACGSADTVIVKVAAAGRPVAVCTRCGEKLGAVLTK